jgi:putative nucleotidyltransferase with HDIG domain
MLDSDKPNMKHQILQIKNQLVNEIKNSNHCVDYFYQDHMLVVEKLAMELCNSHSQAKREAVLLMVWFHDIGRAHNHNENHDVYGAQYASRVLKQHNFTQDFIQLVTAGCKTHSCSQQGKPRSIEGKILATADALSHFHQGFYLKLLSYLSRNRDESSDQLKTQLFAKIERDFQDKIFFQKAREKIRPIYKAWQQIIQAVELRD